MAELKNIEARGEHLHITVSSPELGKHRDVSGKDFDAVYAKAQALADAWTVKERAQNAVRDAEMQTKEAKIKLEKIRNTLRSALKSKPEIDWKKLVAEYSLPKPACPNTLDFPPKPQANKPAKPVYLQCPDRPQEEQAVAKWNEACEQIEAENLRLLNEYTAAVNRCEIEHEPAVAEWYKACNRIKAEKSRRQKGHAVVLEKWNASRIEYETNEIVRLRADYKSLLPNVVVDYCKQLLSLSDFPDNLRGKLNLEYISETKILIVDYSLPAPDDLPRVKEVKYIKSRNNAVGVYLSESEFNQIYDDVLYQICLRTLYELFETDDANALSAVVFNGWVESVDKATGKDAKGCVMSVHAKKEEFQKINLVRVDPKACFKTLKGIGSSTLHSLTPIAPVLKINREDKRFVASHEVVGQLDERTNLAAMDWEDFEHLIRELFEKEFSKSGSEVKVTQASRDGGVDAVVFDPDPIHGGKTVIQAKRYTNTVGVAAVRELYGTALNEGAMKGILVTTADYGPDAYEFAAGKPLVLLNGANLLHLLEKHGHKAKIDLMEAKRILGEKVS
jgi:restriction system protein